MEARNVRNLRARRRSDTRVVSPETVKEEMTLTGVSAAPGIVIGPAYVVDSVTLTIPNRLIDQNEVDAEVAHFKKALDLTREELLDIKRRLANQLGEDHAKIFDAHLMILDDTLVVDDTIDVIKKEQRNAAWAFERVVSNLTRSFTSIEDEYLKDRLADMLDVRKRVIEKLLGRRRTRVTSPEVPSIIIAHELSPSETAQFDRGTVLAYATDLGGRTSHTAILARSQGVSAVVGLEDLSPKVATGDQVIVDGNCGNVIINPLKDTLETYEREIKRYKKFEEQLLTLTGYPAETLDNRRIELFANIDLPDESASAIDYGAEGVGLFRTEYFFIAQDQLPSEDEQYRVYKSVVEKMADRPVTIRVLDIGGDKIAGYLHNSAELNPFMGWRGIRFLLTRKDIFKTQLRAIYRASAHGSVRILLPLIVDVEEVRQAREICDQVREELSTKRFRIGEDVKLGIMIETPASVVMAGVLAKEVDFFSVGTNDLTQYTMAVDRGNTKISHLYQHLHPSMLRMLKMTVDAGRAAPIPVAVCGEMAVDPLAVVVLIGLQFDELSCSPNTLPEVKKIIRSVTYDECKTLVKKILKEPTFDRIERRVTKLLRERCPDLAMFSETPE
jgi:phosphotransferase system enzyme I (PtsI)